MLKFFQVDKIHKKHKFRHFELDKRHKNINFDIPHLTKTIKMLFLSSVNVDFVVFLCYNYN